MALTNIDNLDGLDAVAAINAADETFIKAGLREILHHTNEQLFCLDLFLGQMAAEGFANVSAGEVRAVVESPTARVQFINTGSSMTRIHGFTLVDSEWKRVSEIVTDGQLSAAGA